MLHVDALNDYRFVDRDDYNLAGGPAVGGSAVCSRFRKMAILSLFTLITIMGCGGGGGGGAAPPVNTAPVANAGADLVTYGARSIALAGTASDSDGTIVSHQWVQTGGTTVAITGAATSTIGFTTPSTTETLTFSYTVTDNAGAQSADTVSVHVSEVLFSDSFSFSFLSGSWKLVDDSGNPSSWSVPSGSGELYQQASVNDGAFVESYHTGTFRYLDDPAFSGGSAYRFSVDITPRTNSNDREGNDVGIMFGYTGVNDYYRLTMSARYGFTRLERRSGSGFTTLAVNSIGYVDDQQLNLTLELNGGTAVILIDDEPVFAESNLVISPGTIALYCQDRASFDNVVIAENSPQPLVALSTPLAHSVSLTPGEGSVLPVRAVALNPPAGGSVVFVLDGGPEIASAPSGNQYIASLGVTAGDHDVDAVLKDAAGNDIYRDINAAVGVGGGYAIAVGDSITNGIGDENPFNNDSLDGRVVSRQGFQARLVDDLTAASGLPQIVFNEGLPGDNAFELDDQRIDSILERHPRANRMLLLIGTNDAQPNTNPDLFEGYVTSIANAALTSGVDRVYIATIPPLFDGSGVPETTLNNRIAVFNARILQIVNADPNDAIFPGPLFDSIFDDQYAALYNPDGTHPSDAGYQRMAAEWQAILSATP